jgi:hypothetical protein
MSSTRSTELKCNSPRDAKHGRAKYKSELTHNLEAAGEKQSRRPQPPLLRCACFSLPTLSSNQHQTRVGRRRVVCLLVATLSGLLSRSFVHSFIQSLGFHFSQSAESERAGRRTPRGRGVRVCVCPSQSTEHIKTTITYPTR